jgi:hypothetical protein
MKRRKNSNNGSSRSWASPRRALNTVVTLTTAGPSLRTSAVKSGGPVSADPPAEVAACGVGAGACGAPLEGGDFNAGGASCGRSEHADNAAKTRQQAASRFGSMECAIASCLSCGSEEQDSNRHAERRRVCRLLCSLPRCAHERLAATRRNSAELAHRKHRGLRHVHARQALLPGEQHLVNQPSITKVRSVVSATPPA